MSVLHCSTPNFLTTLAERHDATLAGKPFALLGEDESVWAASEVARQYGIDIDMPAREARARCPALHLQRLDLADGEAQQAAFLGELGRWLLPVEPCGWGAGWIDLHSHTANCAEVQKLAAEMGGRIRRSLGVDLTPQLGWDSSKFVSRMAAHAAHIGAMRLVNKTDESHFLPPRPIALLPLPPPALQQLQWLGIGTLGQYAALPATGVWQRWGKAGRLAQDWARGKDNRPVVDGLQTKPESIVVELDPPSERIDRVVVDAMQTLTPVLARMAQRLRGVRRMDVRCGFVTGADALDKITFVEAASDPKRLQSALAQQLDRLIWHDEMERLELQIVEMGELSGGQLHLFALDGEEDAATANRLAQELATRYGQAFFLGQIPEPLHPAHDLMWKWQPL